MYEALPSLDDLSSVNPMLYSFNFFSFCCMTSIRLISQLSRMSMASVPSLKNPNVVISIMSRPSFCRGKNVNSSL